MLRTLLFAALLGVVTANNATNYTETTTVAPATTPVVTKTLQSTVKFESDYKTVESCNTTCQGGIINWITVSLVQAGSTPQDVFLDTLTAGSLIATFTAVYTGAIVVPSKADFETALNANKAALGATFGTVTDVSATTPTQQADGTVVLTAGVCTMTHYDKVGCLEASTGTSTVLVAATSGTTVAAGSACVLQPGSTVATVAVQSYYTGGSAFVKTKALGTSCNPSQTYLNAAQKKCTVTDAGNKWFKFSCAPAVIASTSSAVGAGLSVVASVVAFLMM